MHKICKIWEFWRVMGFIFIGSCPHSDLHNLSLIGSWCKKSGFGIKPLGTDKSRLSDFKEIWCIMLQEFKMSKQCPKLSNLLRDQYITANWQLYLKYIKKHQTHEQVKNPNASTDNTEKKEGTNVNITDAFLFFKHPKRDNITQRVPLNILRDGKFL